MDWIKLTDIVIWPIVTIILALSFKRPLSDFLGRIKEVSKNGIKTGFEQIQKSPESKDSISGSDLSRAFDSIVSKELEASIYSDLKTQGYSDKNRTTDILVQHLANCQLTLKFEMIHQIIWGSQIQVLNNLNGSPVAVHKNQLLPNYNYAKNAFPLTYQNYTFEQYVKFLADSGLISENQEQVKITELGREYLTYIAKAGKPTNKPN